MPEFSRALLQFVIQERSEFALDHSRVMRLAPCCDGVRLYSYCSYYINRIEGTGRQKTATSGIRRHQCKALAVGQVRLAGSPLPDQDDGFGRFLAGGIASANACHTIRWCTPSFRATPWIVATPNSYLLEQSQFIKRSPRHRGPPFRLLNVDSPGCLVRGGPNKSSEISRMITFP